MSIKNSKSVIAVCVPKALSAISIFLHLAWRIVRPNLFSYSIPLCILFFGFSANGSMMFFLTLLSTSFEPNLPLSENMNDAQMPGTNNNLTKETGGILTKLYLQDLTFHIIASELVAFSFYYIFGAILHYHFYVNKKDTPETWKCQPKKFLPPDLEIDEMIVGSKALFYCNIVSGIISCYISNGGPWSSIYYDISCYPLWWTLLQYPVVFGYQDYITYWLHYFYHTPFMYKKFHKIHHKYKQPTAFSVTAMHPVELVHIQLCLSLPAFSIPVHYTTFLVIAAYTYYHGVIQHSGITFKSRWWQPWQPDCMFHDNHHQYFHVNFGFNCYYWDMLHGTYRKKDRIYTEDIYYGQGRFLHEASPAEIANEVKERRSENPNAYRGNKPEYELLDEDLTHTAPSTASVGNT